MYAPDAAGCEDGDAGGPRRDHRGRDRGRPGAARREAGGQIGAAQLGDVLGLREPAQGVRVEPHMQPPRDHRDGCGAGARGAHVVFNRQRDVEVLRPRHAVGDDGGFERHQSHAVRAGGADLFAFDKLDHSGVTPDT